MPTYDYECQKCGHRFERFQRMSEEPIEGCPECSGTVQRLIGAGAGVIIRGSASHSPGHRESGPSCGLDRPCCGRETPCDSRPCEP